MYVYVCTCVYVCMCVYVYVCTCVYVCTYVYVCTCVYVCMYLCICVYVPVYMYVPMYMYVPVCMYVRVYMYVPMYMCVCTCTYVFMSFRAPTSRLRTFTVSVNFEVFTAVEIVIQVFWVVQAVFSSQKATVQLSYQCVLCIFFYLNYSEAHNTFPSFRVVPTAGRDLLLS
jgi:nuclear pore complex protein Nup62